MALVGWARKLLSRSTTNAYSSPCSLTQRYYSASIVLDDGCASGLYTEDHFQMKDALRRIIEQDINPYVDEWEKAKRYPAHEVFKKLGSAGFLGVTKPTEYGGLGLDYSYSLAIAEELGNINCGAIPMSIGVQTDMATPALARFGSDELKNEFLVPTISGDYVACLGVSEPQAGSDVANIKTTAKRDGDDLIINGTKMWITNGAQADYMCLLANTNQEAPHKSKSLIVLPMNLPGSEPTDGKLCGINQRYTNGKDVLIAGAGIKVDLIDKIGMHCSDTTIISLEDVRVPASHIIGEEGKGFIYQMLQFQEERLWAGAATLHPFDKLIRDTAEYCIQRKAFGKTILDHQVVHYKLAELATEVEALRALLYRACTLYMAGQNVTKLASMVKLKAGQLSRVVPDACLQYWGGMGFTSDVIVSRFYRDFRLISIGGGADEVMLSIIAKEMGIHPPFKP